MTAVNTVLVIDTISVASRETVNQGDTFVSFTNGE